MTAIITTNSSTHLARAAPRPGGGSCWRAETRSSGATRARPRVIDPGGGSSVVVVWSFIPEAR
jgi:hypothetical protein